MSSFHDQETPHRLLDLRVHDVFHPARIAPLSHAITQHPLLTLESLLELAKRLPRASVRFHSGETRTDTDFERAEHTHATGLGLDETLRHIDTSGSFVALHNIQHDAAYRSVVDACLDEIRPFIERADPGMGDRAAWIFISSPGSVTPYHLDHEQNFLLQIMGNKRVHVWDPRDRAVLSERALEAFHAEYTLREVRYDASIQPKANVFELRPGDGVYMPFAAPHWVQNGDAPSITLSLTYRAIAARRTEVLFKSNHALRRLGYRPSPVGASRLEPLKHGAMLAYLGAKKALRPTPDVSPS